METHSPSSTVSPQAFFSKLESLLVQKANEIQLAGRLGERLLSQQAELEAKIRELEEVQGLNQSTSSRARGVGGGEESDDEATGDVGEEARNRLAELENEVRNWETSNNEIFADLGVSSAGANGEDRVIQGQEIDLVSSPIDFGAPPVPPVPSIHSSETDSIGHSMRSAPAPTTPSAAAASRRARNNAQHRANDIEFATEIGQSLLGEVRRLQALLSERDEQISKDRFEREALEGDLEELREAHKVQEGNIEKYKEENWNLEVQVQELRSSLAEAQDSHKKAEQERTRLTKQLATMRETVEQQKLESDKLRTQFDEFKQKHETDVARWGRDHATLAREKSDLQHSLETAKSELVKSKSRIGRVTSHGSHDFERLGGMDEEEEEEDDDEKDANGLMSERRKRRKTGDFHGPDSPSSIPDEKSELASSIVVHPTPENVAATQLLEDVLKVTDGAEAPESVDVLRSSLAQAHKQLLALRNVLKKESQTKMDLMKQLSERLVANGSAWEDEYDQVESSPTKMAGRGRGRGRGGRKRGGFRPAPSGLRRESTPDFEDEQDEDEHLTTNFADELGGADDDSIIEREEEWDGTDDLERSMRSETRFSLEGMDPAFMEFLRTRQEDDGSSAPQIAAKLGIGRQSTDLSASAASRRSIASIIRDGDAQSEVSAVTHVPKPVTVDQETMTDFPEPEPKVVTLEVEKIVEVPKIIEIEKVVEVEKIVEKIVEVPKVVEVEKIVEKVVEKIVPAVIETPSTVPSSPPKELKEISIQTTPPPSPRTPTMPIPAISATSAMEDKVPVEVNHASTETDINQFTKETETQTEPSPSRPSSLPPRSRVDTLVASTPRPPAPVQLPSSVSNTSYASFDSARTSTPTQSIVGDRRDSIYTTRLSMDESVDGGGVTSDVESFEDAQESVGFHTPSHSISFGRSQPFDLNHMPAGRDSFDESETEDLTVLRGTDPSLEKLKRGTPAATSAVGLGPSAVPVVKVETVESGVQTDELILRPLSMYETNKRDSINTFGGRDSRAETPIRDRFDSNDRESLLPTGPVYVQFVGERERPISPSVSARPESVLTTMSALTESASTSTPRRSMPDRSKPPTFTMPPPPKEPPPINLTAPPKSTLGSPVRPPRPSSPPPPELLQRSQTPIMNSPQHSLLLAPSSASKHSPGSPTSFNQPRSYTSAGSLRSNGMRSDASSSEAGVIVKGPHRFNSLSAASANLTGKKKEDEVSGRSLSELSMNSDRSRRPSIASSHTSAGEGALGLPLRGSTDPTIIHAITQTMIGEFLYKYQRKGFMGRGGDKRHRRFFWVHPYTKSLYWSSNDPGGNNVAQSSAKSVYIENVRQITDPNPFPPGLSQHSIVITTQNREMKITAPSRERHDMWFTAIKYLLARPEVPNTPSPSPSAMRAMKSMNTTPLASTLPSRLRGSPYVTSEGEMYNTISDTRVTPKARQKISTSNFKRPDTAAAEFLQNQADYGSPSARTRAYSSPDDDLEVMDHHHHHHHHFHSDDEGGFDDIENVRVCCNKHYAGTPTGTVSRKKTADDSSRKLLFRDGGLSPKGSVSSRSQLSR